ncbi:hypothetical protein FHS18_001686 [Paenibacillus phyllosphaerae]|uniref:Uncharacterized protein n=1 Tax=Paenibacillus phyllosphaerae TaxID=274593 RepID=A0A7W5AVM8_9BACL|nr:DUF6463 family protein [Paenibacillus phyllosphaerae]MBB3109623.1 hypothetical protein [Paenibacillus phyllosphaerae]
MVSRTKRPIGLLLMLTGLLHSIVGIAIYAKHFVPIFSEGLWNTVGEGQWERGTAFWFMMFGLLLMLIGYISDWLMKKKGIAPPASFGWLLFVICLIGAVIMPVSGFWLGLPQAWVLTRA